MTLKCVSTQEKQM
jgi:hypothetical protein